VRLAATVQRTIRCRGDCGWRQSMARGRSSNSTCCAPHCVARHSVNSWSTSGRRSSFTLPSRNCGIAELRLVRLADLLGCVQLRSLVLICAAIFDRLSFTVAIVSTACCITLRGIHVDPAHDSSVST